MIKVFDCFGLCIRALTRASGSLRASEGAISIGWLGPRRRHRGRAPALVAGGRLIRPEPGADGQPPAAALPVQLCSQ